MSTHSTEKKCDLDFRQAIGIVDRIVDSRLNLSTDRGPELDSGFLFGRVQVSFLVNSE